MYGSGEENFHNNFKFLQLFSRNYYYCYYYIILFKNRNTKYHSVVRKYELAAKKCEMVKDLMGRIEIHLQYLIHQKSRKFLSKESNDIQYFNHFLIHCRTRKNTPEIKIGHTTVNYF